MPDTLSWEEATGEAQPKELSWEDAAGPMAPLKLDPLQAAQFKPMLAGFGRPETGMEPGTELTTALGEAQQRATERGMQLATYPFAAAADLLATGLDHPEWGGMGANVRAVRLGQQLPAERFIAESAKYAPNLAVAANVAESLSQMSPLMGMQALPAWMNRLIAGGFSIDMIRNAPEQARQLGEQLGLPAEQRDEGKIAQLKSGLIQTGVFAPLAGAGSLSGIARAKQVSLARAAAEAEKGLADASRIREDARQVPTPGIEPTRRAGEGRPDLEQPAPAEPGRAAPGGEPGAPQEGPQRVLLANQPAVKLMPVAEGATPEYEPAQRKANGEWETHDEIIARAGLRTEDIDRRVFLDEQGNEKSREQTAGELSQQGVGTKVAGEAHSTDVNKLAKPAAAATLHPEIDAVLQAERNSIDHPVEVVAEPTAEGDPFARRKAGQFMGINRAKGTVEVYPRELEEWLRNDVPPDQWSQAVRTRLAEESLHLRTPPKDAEPYWNALSAIEQYSEKRIYLGKGWRARMAVGDISPQDLGFEAIRRRMQRLARMSSSEAAETAGMERWTIRSLEALSDVVRGIRESLGTDASTEQLAIIGRIESNLAAATAAASGQPASLRRKMYKDVGEFLADLDNPDIKLGNDLSSGAGMVVKSIADLDALAKVRREGHKETTRILDLADKEPNREKRFKLVMSVSRLQVKSQLAKEAIEVATDTGAHTEAQAREFEKHGPRPMDWTTNPEVAKWLERNKDLGIVMPEPEPAAIRRGREKGTPEFFMPPVAPGEVVERRPFAAPTPKEIGAAATHHWSDVTKPPSLERFQGELESKYGAMHPDAIYYAWQDAMYQRLMSAKGAELDTLINQLGLRGKLEAEHQQSFGKGSIPDAMDVDRMRQQQFAEMAKLFPHKKVATPRALRQWFGPALRKRYAAIGAIAQKLSEEAGPKPDKPWSRAEVGPEDVNAIMGNRQWYAFNPHEAANAKTVGDVVTRGAAIHAEGKAAPPRSVTRGLLALESKDGKINLVSAWRDPRRGPVATDPDNPSGPSRRIDAKFLGEFRPMAAIQVRDPVQGFRMQFADQAAFDNYFGDVAIEGTEGMRTSSFAGPQAGATRAQAGLTGASAPPPAEAGQIPASLPGRPVITTGARELTLPRFARRGVPAEAIPPEGARPEPAKMLTPEEAQYVAEQARKEFPPRWPGTVYRQLAERKVPKEPYKMGPGALRRNVADEFEAVKSDIGKMVRGFPTADQPARMADSASNRANNIANQLENHVRMASEIARPQTIGERVFGRPVRGEKEMLHAANALVEAGAVRDNGTINNGAINKLSEFRARTLRGLAKARRMEASANWHERRIGRAWARNQQNLLRELDYAQNNWNDPVLQETARRVSQAYREQINFERSKGFDITDKPAYDPHRYDAALWNGESFLFQLTAYEQKILGRRFRESQIFPSYYHAGEAGPYLAVTRDAASLVGHRVRQGQNMVLQEAWKEGLKKVRLPDGRPLAIDPVAGAHRKWLSPKGDYKVVPGANHLAIQDDYVSLIRQLTDPSHIELFGPSRALLHLSQQLKHSILVGDFFHLGRMIYYGLATMGSKAGFKGGWTVLDIADRDIPEAVAKGIIRQSDADWANVRVPFGKGFITRRQLAEKFYSQMGANLGRVQDALYKDLVTELTPTAGEFRRGVVRVLDPSVGRYNRFLFDRLTRGFMAEANVREFERQMRENPNESPHRLMADISRDVNNFFGNIGRQGWLKSKTMQDIARIFWLAPQWVEGLIKKEAIGTARLSGFTKLTGLRQGPTTFGLMGRGIGRGMLFMVGLTQAINLITRRQPTWMNEEKEHRFDAFIPGWGAESEGFWLSPLAIFNEVSHDIYRLSNTKPTFAEVLSQIAGNKEQPVTRALLIGLTGQSPLGQKITTTPGRMLEMGKALAPVPISFGRLGQQALSTTGLVPPPPPGAAYRQAFATLGIKIEPAETSIQKTAKMAREFMDREGLTKETGWQQIQTDEPGYSKLRAAIRAGDDRGARRNLEALRKTRTDADIMRAMKTWAKRGFTGSLKTEGEFIRSLSDEQRELYSKAQEQKQLSFERWLDWYWKQP